MKSLALIIGVMAAAHATETSAASARGGAGLSYQVPLPSYIPPDKPSPRPGEVAGYDRAPLPGDDRQRQAGEAGRNGVSPMLFRPRHQYRGEAFMPGSSAESNERRGLHPGFGLSLTQPME